MQKGRHERKAAVSRQRIALKTAVLTLALLFAVVSVIGGTVAWLSAKTEPVVNTFTYGDIDITLTETDTGDGDDNPNTNEYTMLPGHTITKDPLVTVLAGSENCWLFVKLEKSDNFDDFLAYEIADGWAELPGAAGVYYRQISKAEENQSFPVIKNNTATVKETVTKEMLNELDETAGAETYPTLTITAYAVQYDADLDAINSAEKAWALAAASA